MSSTPPSIRKQSSAMVSPPPIARTQRTHPPKRQQEHRRGGLVGASFSSAWESLWANRLRSLLTTLGVIIGVAAVIAAVTLTAGASALINARIGSLGTNALLISPGTSVAGGAVTALGTQPSLTQADADALAQMPHTANASPILSVSGQVVFGNQNWNTRIQGVYPGYQSIQGWQIAQGAWISKHDELIGLPVAVIGQVVATNLFSASATNPIGQFMRIRNQFFRVVGVLQPKGALGALNQDDIIFVPFAAAQTRLKNVPYVDQIQVQVDSADNVAQSQQAATNLLRTRHRLQGNAANDFQIRSSNQLVQTAQQAAQTLTFLLVGIAGISLTVGGIGIMNIMLVSVTERTREIGVRMAIGARRRDIRNQFLIEALTLSAVGGIIGISLGLLIGLLLTAGFGIPFAPSPVSILLSFGVSAIIGVVFGFYPAVRASRLDPIVALRTD